MKLKQSKLSLFLIVLLGLRLLFLDELIVILLNKFLRFLLQVLDTQVDVFGVLPLLVYLLQLVLAFIVTALAILLWGWLLLFLGFLYASNYNTLLESLTYYQEHLCICVHSPSPWRR